MEGTAILPWHASVREARARYLDYLDAKVAELAAAGSDDLALEETGRQADLARADAVAALSAIVAGGVGAARVDAALTGPWS